MIDSKTMISEKKTLEVNGLEKIDPEEWSALPKRSRPIVRKACYTDKWITSECAVIRPQSLAPQNDQ